MMFWGKWSKERRISSPATDFGDAQKVRLGRVVLDYVEQPRESSATLIMLP